MSMPIRSAPKATIPLLEQGFRPFFLGAALFAGIALPAWIAAFSDGTSWPTHLAPLAWHMHEMIFGYFGGVLGGFILTAIPNWTERLPVRGRPLAVLAGLWLAGRIAMATSAGWPIWASVLEASYLVALSLVAWRELIASRSIKNLPICALITLVALADIGFHVTSLLDADVFLFVRMALAIAALLISLIGGRIVPSFTRNWLVKQGEDALPAAFGIFDKATLAITAVALVVWIAQPLSVGAGVLLAVVAPLQAIRVARWRFWRTAREPLVLILHVGSFWLVAWFVLEAISILASDVLDASTALHALTTGAVGTMTLAVMTRAILGHTGRALTAGAGTVAIYVLVNLGALLRIAVPLFENGVTAPLTVSGLLWAAAFLLFAFIYGPMMLRPHLSRK